MTDKPIIMRAPHALALLDGRKTQHRVALKPQPAITSGSFYRPFPTTKPREWHSVSRAGSVANIQVTRYAIGDRLWVREAFADGGDYYGTHYRADRSASDPAALGGSWFSPPIHMPRRLSRITLTVTDVRVERLQEISAEDARAEGHPLEPWRSDSQDAHNDAARDWFMDQWRDIHGPDAWAANPWVAALTFTVEKGNIDYA